MTDKEREDLFKEHHEEFKTLVGKRLHKWRAFSIMEREDVESILLTRIYQQLHLYDVTRPIDRWVNTLISNAMMNLLRDNLYRDSPPCTSGQAPGFNMGSSYGRGCACYRGDGLCSWTKSGVADSSCRFFASWEKKKKNKHAINATLSIENHVDESHSMPDEILSEERIDSAKKTVDENIKRRLTKEEYRVYIYMYVKHLTIEETVKKMGFKKASKDDMKGYMIVRNAAILVREVAKAILSEQGIIK